MEPSGDHIFIQNERATVGGKVIWQNIAQLSAGKPAIGGELENFISAWQFLALVPQRMGQPVPQTRTGERLRLAKDGYNIAEYLLDIRRRDLQAFEGIVETLSCVLDYAQDLQPAITSELERIYNSMELRPYYSDRDDDYLPPIVWNVGRSCVEGQLQVAVKTEDESGMQAVVVTHRPPEELDAPVAAGSWQSFELTDADGDRVWTGALPVSDLETCLKISFFVQAVDQAGNVQMSGNKGRFFKAPAVAPAPDPVYRGQVTPAASALSGQPGTSVIYTLQVTNSGDISDTFDVVLNYTWPTTASQVTIGPLSPGVSATLDVMVHIPGDAQVGLTDTATVTITSQGDHEQSASATLTTSASPYQLFLPLLVRRS